MTFELLPARPPGASRHARHPRPKLWIGGLHNLCLFYRALVKALEPPLVGSSSHGIRVSPSRRHTSCASTPRSRSSLRTDAAKRRFVFRPRGFAPPQRFAPRWSYGSVAPRNRPRVRRVSCVPPPHDARRRLGSTGCSPRDAVHTLRRFPLISSRSASLRPLPSCRYRPARRGRRPKPVVLADRRSPKREAYVRDSLPAGCRLALPRGAGGQFPYEMGGSCLERAGDSVAPKSAEGPDPVERCAPGSEELCVRRTGEARLATLRRVPSA
jgi:hypothetical protein